MSDAWFLTAGGAGQNSRPNGGTPRRREAHYGEESGRAKASAAEIGGLSMKSSVEAGFFSGLVNLDRRHPVDQPQHPVSETEGPDRRDGHGDDLLEEEA